MINAHPKKVLFSQNSIEPGTRTSKYERLGYFSHALSRQDSLLQGREPPDQGNFPSFVTEEVLSMPPLPLLGASPDFYWQEISSNLIQKNPTNFFFKRMRPKGLAQSSSTSFQRSDTVSPSILINREIVARGWESKKKALLEYCRNKNSLREKFRVLGFTARTITRVSKEQISQKVLYKKRKSIERDFFVEEETSEPRREDVISENPLDLKTRRRKSAELELVSGGKGEKLGALLQVTNRKMKKREFKTNGEVSENKKKTENASKQTLDRIKNEQDDFRRENIRRKNSRMIRVRKKTHVIVVMSNPKKGTQLAKIGVPLMGRASISRVGNSRGSQVFSSGRMTEGRASIFKSKYVTVNDKITLEENNPGNNNSSIENLEPNCSRKIIEPGVPPSQISLDQAEQTQQEEENTKVPEPVLEEESPPQNIEMKEEENEDDEGGMSENKSSQDDFNALEIETIDEEDLRNLQMLHEWEENKNIYLKHTVPSEQSGAKYLQSSHCSDDFGRTTGFGNGFKLRKNKSKESNGSHLPNKKAMSSGGFTQRASSPGFVIKSPRKHWKPQGGLDLDIPESLIKKNSYFNLFQNEKKIGLGNIFHSKRSSMPSPRPLASFGLSTARSNPKSGEKGVYNVQGFTATSSGNKNEPASKLNRIKIKIKSDFQAKKSKFAKSFV